MKLKLCKPLVNSVFNRDSRFPKLLTKKIYKEEGWVYNIAITHYLLENNEEAINLLNSCIKINKIDFPIRKHLTLYVGVQKKMIVEHM